MPPVRDYLRLLFGRFRATVRDRGDLVAENLLLRHQLVVLTRPTRRRPRPRARDKLFWIVARMLRRDWRRHRVLVRPATHPLAVGYTYSGAVTSDHHAASRSY